MKDIEKQNARLHSGIVYTIAIGIMVVAITAAASFTTQKMAKIFQYHPALGEPIFSHFISHIVLLCGISSINSQ